MMFKRITIIGLGLIGGSLGLAIKERRLAGHIVGFSRRPSTVRKALKLGVIDSGGFNLYKAVRGSDFIVLAAPVLKIIEIAKALAYALPRGYIVTDAGSTKKEIVKALKSVFPETVSFIGSHPLAGSEKSGLDYADKDLFKGAYCILTKTGHSDPRALRKVSAFWKKLGMRVELMSAESHDKIVSKFSHLPHAVSVCLANSCGKKDLRFAAGGFKDTTRIASGRADLWKDIFLTNKANILKDIKVFRKELVKIEKALRDADGDMLIKLFGRARSIRDAV